MIITFLTGLAIGALLVRKFSCVKCDVIDFHKKSINLIKKLHLNQLKTIRELAEDPTQTTYTLSYIDSIINYEKNA